MFKKINDIVYHKILKIPVPPAKGDWMGGKLIDRKFDLRQVELHDKRTDTYDGIAVHPPQIAQDMINSKSHMILHSNRGRDFDSVWKHLKSTITFGSNAAITLLGGFILLVLDLNLWPIAMLIWMYSGYQSGMFFVTRHRYFTQRTRQTIAQSLQHPSEVWSDPEGPYGGE